MTLILMEGFDHISAAQLGRKWASSVTNMTTGRFGGQAAYASSTAFPVPLVSKFFANTQTLILGAAMALPTFNNVLWQFVDTATVQVDLRVDANGYLYFTRNSTQIGGLTAQPIVPNTWYYFEIKVVIDPTAGSAQLKIAETTVLNVTGVNTRASANSYANRVQVPVTANKVTWIVDDIYLLNTAGTVNNDFLGDTRVETLWPTGAGNASQWTPSAGSNYACVDDTTSSNDDTDYISTTTVNNVDTYAAGNLATLTGTIKAIQPVMIAKLDTAGTRSVAPVMRTGGADYPGTSQAITSTTYLAYSEIQELNPATSQPWTIAEINAAEVGVKCTA